MNAVEIYIECEVLRVRLQLAPASDASRLETLVLRAIEPETPDRGDSPPRGVDNYLELARLFGLTPRMMIDLVGDLWRNQRLTIDFGAQPERLQLTDKARTELGALHSDGSLPSSLRAVDSQEVLLETLTGTVLPIGIARWRPRHAGLKVPRTSNDKRPSDIERHELAAAVQRNLERNDDRPPFRVVDAHLTPNTENKGNPVQYFPLTIKAGLTPNGRLMVDVDDRFLNRAAQRTATHRLQQFIEDEPTHNFVKTLRGQAAQIRSDPADRIESQLDALQRVIATIGQADKNRRQSHHDRAAATTALAANRLQDMATRQMTVTTLQTTDEHYAEICAMLAAAERKVVIAVPWIRYNGLYPYLAALSEAVDRGVEVAVLWGIDRQRGTLDTAVINAFDGISRSAAATDNGGALHYDRSVPSHVHAKVVIADDRRILVTSKNFFTDSNHPEIGVSATALTGAPSPVIEDLLRWARDTTPSARIAGAIVTDRRMYGPRQAIAIPPPPIPAFNAAMLTSPADAASVRLWARAWQATGHQLTHTPDNLLPVTTLVTDGLHRTLLWQALRGASRRVVICSDQLSPDIVTDDFIDEVDQCLGRGVDVLIVYNRFPRDDNERAQHQVDGLTALSDKRETGRGRIVVRRDNNTHAKVLVHDHSVVIGSYNYLSFEATYRSGRRRQRSEVSLSIRSPEFASAVAVLAGAPTYTLPLAVTATDGAHDDLLAHDVMTSLDAEEPDAAAIATLCRSGTTEFAVVDALVAAGADPHSLTRTYAATLSELSIDDDHHHQEWQQRLLRLLWQQGQWQAADVVRDSIQSPDLRPRRILTRIARNGTAATDPVALEEAALTDDLTAAESSAIALCAAVAYLRTGTDSLRQVTDFAAAAVAAPALGFVESAHNHVDRFGLLPRRALADHTRAQSVAAAETAGWQSISEAMGALRKAQPSCIQERLTKAYLLDSGASIGILDAICDAKSLVDLGKWLAQNDGDLGQWLDKATRASGSRHLIEGRSRKSMLTKIGDIFKAVRRLVEADPAFGGSELTEELITHLQTLAGAAREAMLSLPAEVESQLPYAALGELIDTITGTAVEQGESPIVWRYPRLLVADLFESPSPQGRAQILAADLFRSWSIDTAVESLISAGEFLAATELIDERGGDTAQLRSQVDAAHAAATERISTRRRELLAGYDRAGLPEPTLADIGDTIDFRTATADAELKNLAQRLADDEREAARGLEAEILATDTHLSADRQRHLNDLIAIGELKVARDLLRRDDDRALVPLHEVERPWRWPHTPLPQIVRSLTHSLERKPGMEAFTPAADDVTGHRLLDALTDLTNDGPGAIHGYVAAVQDLIAQVDTTPVLSEESGIAFTHLMLPDTMRLPKLSFAGRDGIRGAIGPRAGNARLRLSLRVTDTPNIVGEAVIDVASVLSLLAKNTDGRTRDRADRYVAFLRIICTQMTFDDVVEPEAFEFATIDELRPRLWWLLYLLSVGNSAVLVDGLLEISGGHPFPLWTLLRGEMTRIRKEGGLFSLERIRARLDHWATDAVVADIDDKPSAAILLIILGYQVTDEQGIRDGVVDILQQLHTPVTIEAIIDIDAALARLRAKKYILSPHADNARLEACGCGMIRAVARSTPLAAAHTVIADLVTTHHSDLRRTARDAMRRRAAIGYLHELGRPAHGLSPDPRADAEANRKTTALEDVWLQPAVVDVFAEVSKVCVRLRPAAGSVDIVVTPEVNPGATVLLPPLALVLLVENLVRNAAEAAAPTDADRDEPGTVSVKVSIDPTGDSAVIDVEDSGPGVTDSVRNSLQRSEIPLSSKHEGYGVGLHEAMVTVAENNGTLTLMPTRGRRGGAHFRATLPLHRGKPR